ncbi:hypothetical protein KDW_29530 [Dictyobacter vulcani]|uniref:Cardiolipin synthase N-terminal domain-containing protein n=1 Tax=Dictyobacter vulcani TaxID=2607529 RepID=A0A5J4KQW2_9CHLR|nr:PLD nuclease N-terminal domain-containing protein [Dictyobacter vulcani]GER88791.1 hypothetical protein KDW_29530 [Dictyobacter vulcani]
MFYPFNALLYLLGIGSPGLAALAAIFWVWVIVDCLTKEPANTNDKMAWLSFILCVPFFGALLYYFIRRPERLKTVGR